MFKEVVNELEKYQKYIKDTFFESSNTSTIFLGNFNSEAILKNK